MRNPYLSTEIVIGRDTNIIKSEPVQGQMTFQDNVVTTPVTLNDLLGASGSSSQMILAEVASVSGNLQTQIDTIDGQIDTINDQIANTNASGSGTALSVVYNSNTINDVGSIEFTGTGISSVVDNGGGNVTITIDASGSQGSSYPEVGVVDVTGDAFMPDGLLTAYNYYLTNNATLSCPESTMPNGSTITVAINQPSTAYNITFDDANGFVWKFPNGDPITLTNEANAVDILSILRINTNMYTTVIKKFA